MRVAPSEDGRRTKKRKKDEKQAEKPLTVQVTGTPIGEPFQTKREFMGSGCFVTPKRPGAE